MPTLEIEAPSGLKGRIRNLTGRDGRYLSDREVQRQGTLVEHILSNCWLETIDHGVYDAKREQPRWSDVLQGDRTFILIQIRIATHGPTYPFKAQCANESCRKRRFEWEIDLDELPVRKLPEAARAKLASGENRFEVRVPGTEELREPEASGDELTVSRRRPAPIIVPDTGTRIAFSLPTGADEKRAVKLQEQLRKASKGGDLETNNLVNAILLRVLDIEGVDRGKKDSGFLDYLEDRSLAELGTLLDRFDDFDCGVETTVEIECPTCSLVQEVRLPFDEAFFFPRRGRAA